MPLTASNLVDLVAGASSAWISAAVGLAFHYQNRADRGGADGSRGTPTARSSTLPTAAARHRGPAWARAAASWSCPLLVVATVVPSEQSESGGPHEPKSSPAESCKGGRTSGMRSWP
jgi:hypothetical protein